MAQCETGIFRPVLQSGNLCAVLQYVRKNITRLQKIVQFDIYLQPTFCFRPDKGVGNVGALIHVQVHVTVDATVGEVVYHKAERRLIERFTAVHLDDKYIVAFVQKSRNVNGKSRVTATVCADDCAVDKNFAIMRHSLKSENVPALQIVGMQNTSVTADKLIHTFVKTVEGRLHVGVRQTHLFSPVGIEHAFRPLRKKLPAVV